MAVMSKFSPDNGLNVYDIRDRIGEQEQIDLLKDTTGWIGKNLLKNYATSQEVNGVTFTVNNDKSVTMNGTNTHSTNAIVYFIHNRTIDDLDMPAGDYILSIGDVELPPSIYVRALCTRNGSAVTYVDVRHGEEKFTKLAGDIVGVAIVVTVGGTANNYTVKPMIRKAEIVDGIYEPYHESVEDTLRDAEVIKSNNLYNPKKKSLDNCDISENNGEITLTAVSGNYPSLNIFDVNYDNKLAAGKTYTMSVYCVSKGLNNPKIAFRKKSDNIIIKIIDIVAGLNVFTETLEVDGYVSIFARYNNTNASTIVIKEIMLQYGSGEDLTYSPYYIPLKESKYNNRYEANLLNSKNLNQTNYRNVTTGGITFVNNGDGTVTISGISTTEITDGGSIEESFVAPFDAQVILSGGINTNRHIYPWDRTNNVRPWKDSSKTTRHSGNVGTDETSFWMEKGISYCMIVRVRANEDVSTPQTFKPLLRLATDPDGTYVPPAKTNRQLMIDKVDESAIAEVQNGTNPSRQITAGEHFMNDGDFCTAKQTITTADTFTDSNTKRGTVSEFVEDTIADNLVKQAAFIITTNAGGLANLTDQNSRIILRIDVANSKICLPYRTSDGTNNIIVFNNDMTVAANLEVSGTYYYI